MLAPLEHRGPDEWGVYVNSHLALGHVRLSIIDPTGGHQPMNSFRSTIAYNGEVYNYIELRRELRALGRHFQTDSDTEVVQQAMEEWGVAALPKFNGQFAFLFWDKRNKQLIAARDRFGIRPLYYLPYKGAVYFASEMKAFDALPDFRRTWHPDNLLIHGVLWNTLDAHTVFKDVQSLPAGCVAVFKGQEKVDLQTYYQIGASAAEVPASFDEATLQLKALLQDAVRLRLRSDVPVGCYLSGGIDSSVITLLCKAVKKERFKSFSVVFDDETFDESHYQDAMTALIQSDHHAQTIDLDHIDKHFLDAAYFFERPVFRTAPLPLFLLSKKVRQEGIKVVLTGEAADELFCGYDTFKEMKLLRAWEEGAGREDIRKILFQLYPHLAHYGAKDKLGFLEMYYEGFLGKTGGPSAGLAIRIHNNQVLSKYLNKDWGVTFRLDTLETLVEAMLPANVKQWPVLRRNQFLEVKTLLSGYLLSSQGDRMAMAHSVEGRFPFLDHRIVDWAFNLPETYKLNGLREKHILKEAFGRALPAAIVDRPKRPYMAPELAAFIRNGKPTEKTAYFLDDQRIRDYGLFDPKMVARLLFKYRRRGIRDIGYRDNMLVSFILSAQMVEYWIRHPQSRRLTDSRRQVDIMEQ